jgi:6-phosphogluconolactonase
MRLDTRILSDIDALSRAALEEMLSDLREGIAQRGRGAIALSGGHTPEKMYALWAANVKYRNETDWNRVHLFWGD